MELLVVIGIIGILGGLVIPAVSGARTQAHWAEDSNNLRQLGAGILGYMSERPRQYLPFPPV